MSCRLIVPSLGIESYNFRQFSPEFLIFWACILSVGIAHRTLLDNFLVQKKVTSFLILLQTV